jgi:type IV pilus assembly protein PilE
MQAHKTRGFTLIELMIVVAILAITAVYAYTSYSQYGFRARRSEGQQYITQIAAAEERHMTAVNSYTISVTGAAPGGLGFAGNTSTPNGYYTVVVTLPAGGGYLITGTPAGSQANDKCGNLTLDSTGTKLPAAATMPQNSNGSCW